jgi:hypothetical protein
MEKLRVVLSYASRGALPRKLVVMTSPPLFSGIDDCTTRKANLAPLSCQRTVNKAHAPRLQSSCFQGPEYILKQEFLNRQLLRDMAMAKTPQRCHFWRLPPELRLMIYDYAYGREKNIKLMRISRGLVALEFGPRGRPYEVLTCPDRYVVSRRRTRI